MHCILGRGFVERRRYLRSVIFITDEYLPRSVPVVGKCLTGTILRSSPQVDHPLTSWHPGYCVSFSLRRKKRLFITYGNKANILYVLYQRQAHEYVVSKMNTFSSRPITIASLDLEVTPFLLATCCLWTKAEIILSDGQVENISGVPELQPPITLRPRDDVTLI